MAFPSKRREALVISVTILKAAKHGARTTRLMSLVSLSYGQFVRYVTFLKACGFIEEYDGLYQTTDRGLKLIDEFESSLFIRDLLIT